MTGIIVCMGILLAAGMLVANWRMEKYLHDHPSSDQKWGFQFYRPGFLPPSFRITEERVSVSESNGKVFGVSAGLNFRTEDWVYSIQESKAASQEATTSLRNFDPTSKEVTCGQETSPKGIAYRLCHWVDYDKISVYELKFVKDSTYIDVKLPAAKDAIVADVDLDRFVDSFKEADAPGNVIRGI